MVTYREAEDKMNGDVVEFRFFTDSDDKTPRIEVWVNGSWELLCELTNEGKLYLGYFTKAEIEAIPLQFTEDGIIKVET
jgi:hypothetical protein